MATVLIVDDVEHNRFLLEEALDGLGLEVHTAESGTRALEIVAASDPEVIVLDLQMPGMDGADTSRRIRERSPLAYVLLVSGYHEAEAGDDLRRARADRFLGKPYSLDDIRSAVEEGLRIARERRASATS